MKDRNVLRCEFDGFEIFTEADRRNCAKCGKEMIFICKENEWSRNEN